MILNLGLLLQILKKDFIKKDNNSTKNSEHED